MPAYHRPTGKHLCFFQSQSFLHTFGMVCCHHLIQNSYPSFKIHFKYQCHPEVFTVNPSPKPDYYFLIYSFVGFLFIHFMKLSCTKLIIFLYTLPCLIFHPSVLYIMLPAPSSASDMYIRVGLKYGILLEFSKNQLKAIEIV